MKPRAVFGIVVVCCAIGLGGPSPLRGQSLREIKQARLKGIEFLKSQQNPDGSWNYTGHPVGITALCTLALLENGLPVSDPVIEKGHQFVRKNTSDLKQTYDLALTILLLSRMGEQRNRTTIRKMAARLIAGQLTSGGWSYTCPLASTGSTRKRRRRAKPKAGFGDNSCTQFAVLGLWTASRGGVKVGDAMAQVAQRFAGSQNEDGGWPYGQSTDAKKQASKNSMTFAGLFCLTVARASRLREAQGKSAKTTSSQNKADQRGTLMEYPIFAKGLKRAEGYVKAGGSARYYLWSVERLGVLLGLGQFGGVDWFQKGAATLLKTQLKDGSWPDAKGGLSDTAFAILFLRKANLGSDISRLLEGEPTKRFQITNRKGRPRFDTLQAAMAAAAAGDTIRVDGNGPYKLPHVDVKRDLTIEAGFGYLPVFHYDIGYDPDGVRSSPERNPDARHMIRVRGGELTLEGLKLEMDAPEVGKSVPWAAISVAGGHVRLLNCTITEQGKKGMASVVLSKPGTVQVRNSALTGGRAAVEVVANGKQQVTIDNSLLFSKQGIRVLGGKAAVATAAELTIRFNETTIQADNAFHFPDVSTPIHIESHRCAYKTDWMGREMLASEQGRQHRSYRGGHNVYDVSKWLGRGGRSLSAVRDAKTWNTFWGGSDKDSKADSLYFAVRRSNTAFSHRLRPQDWEISKRSRYSSGRKDRVGARLLIVGAGRSFSRFRESIHYNQWKQGTLDELTAR